MDDEKRSETLGVQGSTAADFARKLSRSQSSGSSSNGKGKTIRSPGYNKTGRKRRTAESDRLGKRRKDEPDGDWDNEMADSDEAPTDDEN